MTVFYFITKSEPGGAQTHVAQMTECLLSRGHRVAIMSAPGGWLEVEARRMGAHFYPNTFLGNTISPRKLWRAGRQFLEVVRAVKPDIVACHSTVAGLIGRYALRGQTRTVFTAHGWAFTQGAPFFRRVLLVLLEKIAAKFTERIICVSKNDADLAKQFHIAPAKKIVKIGNGVFCPPLASHARNEKLIEIMFVGRLAAPKTPLLLIEAVHKLPDHLQKQIKVSIIGDGPQKRRLLSEIHAHSLGERIVLMGALPRDEILSLLREQTDIFVLTSRFEGLPYTILEAMSVGLPVIATDVGGIKEAVGDDAGILIPPGDADALCQALILLIQDTALRERMGRSGHARVLRFFNVREMCAHTLALYESVLYGNK